MAFYSNSFALVFEIKDIGLMMSCSWFKTTNLVCCNQHRHVLASLVFSLLFSCCSVSQLFTEEMFHCVRAKYLEDVYLIILRFWKAMYAWKSPYPYSGIFFFVYV